MSLLGLFAVVCDRCHQQSDQPAADAVTARTLSTAAGWELAIVGANARDLCPRCLAFKPASPLVDAHPTPDLWVCPECEQSKHGNCDGWAWDFDADEKTQCQCTEVHP